MSKPDYETDMRVWQGEEDWIVARSHKELIEVLINLGWEEEYEGDWELLPPEKNLTIWEGSPGENEQTKTCAEWAKESTEPGLLASSNW